jgi:hypothetical protein
MKQIKSNKLDFGGQNTCFFAINVFLISSTPFTVTEPEKTQRKKWITKRVRQG